MGRKRNKQRSTFQANIPESTAASYRIGEVVGSENRSTEFKEGFGFIKNNFRINVAKYVSAFVNSNESGRLLIGVSDLGEVKGIECNHHTIDDVTKQVDEAIKDITPHIFPQDYSVTFIQVLGNDDRQLVGGRGNVVVLEIYVAGSNIDTGGVLCQTRQGVYIRRDGSVQELSAREIQEWTRRKYQSEIDRMKNNERNVEHRYRMKENEMERRMNELEGKLKTAEDKRERERNELLEKDAAIKRLENETKQLNEQLEILTQQNEPQGAEGGNETVEDIRHIRRMLEEQSRNNQKKSKVCVVS